MGIFAGFGFYLMLLYRPGHNKYRYIYLGGFCICSFILESIIDAGVIYYIFKNIPFWLISKLQYLSYVGSVITMLLFVRSSYKKEVPSKFFYVVTVIDIMYVSLIIISPLEIYSRSTIIYISIFTANTLCGFITLIKAIKNKYSFAFLLLIGISAICLSTVIDILYVNSNVDSYFG